MNLTQTRRSLGPIATEGSVIVGTQKFYTLEPALGGSVPGEPVPAGTYRLVPHDSKPKPPSSERPHGHPGYGRIWALVNPELGVYHQLEDAPADKRATARYACLWMHSGTWDQDTLGCTLGGLAYGMLRDPTSNRMEPAVFNSRAAIALLKEVLPWTEHSLTIVDPL